MRTSSLYRSRACAGCTGGARTARGPYLRTGPLSSKSQSCGAHGGKYGNAAADLIVPNLGPLHQYPIRSYRYTVAVFPLPCKNVLKYHTRQNVGGISILVFYAKCTRESRPHFAACGTPDRAMHHVVNDVVSGLSVTRTHHRGLLIAWNPPFPPMTGPPPYASR
jgi:hypothetical protein